MVHQCDRIETEMRRKSDATLEQGSQSLPAQGGQLPPAAVVLYNQRRTEKERLDALKTRLWGDAELGGDDVRAVRPFSERGEVLLFGGAEAGVVDTIRGAGSQKVPRRE